MSQPPGIKRKEIDSVNEHQEQVIKRQRLMSKVSLLEMTRQLRSIRMKHLPTNASDFRQIMINRSVFIEELAAMLHGEIEFTMKDFIARALNLEDWVDEFNKLRVYPDQREVVSNLAFCLIVE